MQRSALLISIPFSLSTGIVAAQEEPSDAPADVAVKKREAPLPAADSTTEVASADGGEDGSGVISDAPNTPEAPSDSAPLAPVQARELSCRPDCREGFVCVDGECVSACNPPCPDDLRCTSRATCIIPAPAQDPGDAESDLDKPREDRREPPLPPRAVRRSLRFEFSAFPQYFWVATGYPASTLEALSDEDGTDALESGPSALGWGLGLGLRRHYADYLGMQARLVLGLHTVYAGISEKLITMTSGVVEVTHLLGPFGKFYVGPTVFAGGLVFDGRAFLSPEGASPDRLVPLLVYGAGGETGLHLGAQEEVALLIKVLAGNIAGPPSPLSRNSALFHLSAGASIAF